MITELKEVLLKIGEMKDQEQRQIAKMLADQIAGIELYKIARMN